MVARAVVLCGGTAWVSIGAEAVGTVLLIHTFCLGWHRLGAHREFHRDDLRWGNESRKQSPSLSLMSLGILIRDVLTPHYPYPPVAPDASEYQLLQNDT